MVASDTAASTEIYIYRYTHSTIRRSYYAIWHETVWIVELETHEITDRRKRVTQTLYQMESAYTHPKQCHALYPVTRVSMPAMLDETKQEAKDHAH